MAAEASVKFSIALTVPSKSTVISYHPSLVLATGCSYGRKTPGHIALHSLHVHQVVRKEKKMFSISEELQHPSMSRDSSDRSDSSTGGHPVSMAPDVKMYSNLYWEEENLEASLHGGSDSGLMESVPWELDTKDPSSSLDLELSMDLAKKLLLANQAMGLDQENPTLGSFDSTFPPPGVSKPTSRCSNPR